VVKPVIAFVLRFAIFATGSTGAAFAAANAPDVGVVEYYNAKLDRYFITADDAEISALDRREVDGWSRTGYAFSAFAPSAADRDLVPVCRLYATSGAHANSHLYAASADGCKAKRGEGTWVLESANVFRVRLPDAATGRCVGGTTPVYGVVDSRDDANRRYTADVAVRNAMLARGWLPKAQSAGGVAFCARSHTTAVRLGVSILPRDLGAGAFSFGNIVAALASGQGMTYRWTFGDGTTADGAAVSHRYAVPGTYAVVLDVSDGHGHAGSAARIVRATGAANEASAPEFPDDDMPRAVPGVMRWFDAAWQEAPDAAGESASAVRD
jgi:hypothetical protein